MVKNHIALLSLFFALLPLFFANGAFAQAGNPIPIPVIQASSGQPRAGVTITVCNSPAVLSNGVCTNYASIFSDSGLTQAITQPGTTLKTDGLGNCCVIGVSPVTVYAAPGTYTFTVSGAGITTPSGPYTVAVSIPLSNNNNFTGNVSISSPGSLTVSGTGTLLNDIFIGASSPPTNSNCGFHFETFPGSGVGSAVVVSAPTTIFPFGCDTVYRHDGPSDNNWAITSVRATTTASITGGAANTNVLVSSICNFNSFFGGNQGPCGTTSSLAQASGQQLTIGRTISGLVFGNAGTLDTMTWSGGSGCATAHTWGVVDATHLCLNPTNSYSGTTDIEQGPGITFVHDWVWQMHGDATKPAQQTASNPGLAIEDKNGTPYFTFPSDLTTTSPNNAINVKAPLAVSGTGTFATVNKTQHCETFAGATADVQIAACIAALPSGGIADATGYGATTQSLAAQVTVPTGITLIVDPNTKLQAASSTLNPFVVKVNAHVRGVHFDCGNQPSYSGNLFTFNDAYTDGNDTSVDDVHITCSGVATGTAALFSSASPAQPITWIRLNHWRQFGLQQQVLLTASGNGFVNDNHFLDMQMTRGGTASQQLHYTTAGGQIQANQCLQCSFEGQSVNTDSGVVFDGTSGVNDANNNNLYVGDIWDTSAPVQNLNPTKAAGNIFYLGNGQVALTADPVNNYSTPNLVQYSKTIQVTGPTQNTYGLVVPGSQTWFKLGTFVAGGQSDTLRIEYHGGQGFSSNLGQGGTGSITVRQGNASVAPNLAAVFWIENVESGSLGAIANVKVAATGGSTSTSNASWDVYVLMNAFSSGNFTFFYPLGDTFLYLGATTTDPGVASSSLVVGSSGFILPVTQPLVSAASLRGSQVVSDQGSICTNGELALSAGWQSTGSATVTAVAGNGQTCSWTITTGTTTAANPTVTDTLTNALPAATTRCWMFLEYGPASTHTAAAGEGFAQTTLSATAPVFTFNGTPTAAGKTYLVVRTCGP